MAVNIITAANSTTSSLDDNDANAFLLVKYDGSVISTVANFSAYRAYGADASVTVEGSVIAQYASAVALFSSDGGGDVTVSASGVVKGGSNGVLANGNDNVVTNAGLISGGQSYAPGSSSGILFSGIYDRVVNSGLITGYYGIRSENTSGYVEIQNTGTVSGGSYSLISYQNTYLQNDGLLLGTVSVSGYFSLINYGKVEGSIYGGTSNNGVNIENHGSLAYVGGAGYNDYINNTGEIFSISLQSGDDSVVNYGTIGSYVSLGESSSSASDSNVLTNPGTISGDVYGGSGVDTIDTSTGSILGRVYLYDGADTYTGGDARDRVNGGTGADTINLGGGNDVYFAIDTDGKDEIDGGDGVDTYNGSALTSGFIIDLDAAITNSTLGNDIFVGFENVIGGAGGDNIAGSDDQNRIDGGGGGDRIDSGAGNDRLIGGTGADYLTGGAGRDIMTGGAPGAPNEADRFVFDDGDSGTSAKSRDVITDFTDHGTTMPPGADLIDLRLVDAKSTVNGDQAFSFNAVEGAAFSGVAGSLIWQQTTTYALVLGDTDGDGRADFVIQVNGVHSLTASDFLL